MFPIVLVLIVAIILYIWNFPSGPSGFAIYVSVWIKQKKDTLLSVLLKGKFINQSYDKRSDFLLCRLQSQTLPSGVPSQPCRASPTGPNER